MNGRKEKETRYGEKRKGGKSEWRRGKLKRTPTGGKVNEREGNGGGTGGKRREGNRRDGEVREGGEKEEGGRTGLN